MRPSPAGRKRPDQKGDAGHPRPDIERQEVIASKRPRFLLALIGLPPVEAMELLLGKLKKIRTNIEFLLSMQVS